MNLQREHQRGAFDDSVEIDPATGRTVRRLERFRRVIEAKQIDFHLILENVHDPHNVSAVLRTCDAVGVGTVHLVYTFEEFPKIGRQSSAGVGKWANLQRYRSIEECYQTLRDQGVGIYATDLTEDAVGLYELDMTAPIALVFGNEHRGISEEASQLADGNFHIPMFGLAQSLNISVACAVSLYEGLRQRLSTGKYDTPGLPEQEINRMLQEWIEK